MVEKEEMSNYYGEKWKEIHSKALSESKEDYCKYIHALCLTLACPSCRAHFQRYVSGHPPENSSDLFLWSWELHNNVNLRLRKKILDLESAKALYTKSQ